MLVKPIRCMLVKLMVARAVSEGAGFRRRVALLAVLGVAVCCTALPAVSLAASKPSIGAPSAEVGGNEATLKAPIRPGGLETNYEVWLQCTSQSCTSTESHRVADGSINSGLEHEVNVLLTSLEWNTSYTFEVIASNKDGTVSSYPQTFTTGSPPPAGCPDGCSENKPYESKLEPWVLEGAEREAKEAPRLEEEREAKAKEEAERPGKEAAARAAHEREIREAGERAGREAAEREHLAEQASAVACLVPSLKGDSLGAARSALSKAHCKLGKVSKTRGHHKTLVVSGQSAKSGKTLADGAAVAVKLGPMHG
jgi:hypothetical protein